MSQLSHTGNHITASIEFDFKGEHFCFSSEIDLDEWVNKQHADITAIYDTLAFQHGLDHYRYEYDVMVMEPLRFSQPRGLAADFFDGQHFDIDGFLQAHHREHILQALEPIVQQELKTSIHELPEAWRKALTQAFLSGERQAQKRSG